MYMVRGTELGDFLRCRLAWKYRWIDGLTPKKPNNKLLFGTMFHKFLEVLYSTGGNYWEAIEASEQLSQETDTSEMNEVEFQELKLLMNEVTKNYYDEYNPMDSNWEVIATELTFAIPLDDEIGYTGTIDLIVRDKSDGRIYFLDHKTTNSIEKYDKNSDMDRQISRYWWALQQLTDGNGEILENGQWVHTTESNLWRVDSRGIAGECENIGGFIYNIILKDYPVPPKVLKNGSLSKDKSQHTTYKMYMDTLYEMDINGQKPNWDDYRDILDHLRFNPREYLRRIRVTRTQSEIDASIEELYATALDMSPHEYTLYKGHRPLPKIYRNITKDCPWCPFQPICQSSMDGSNVDFLVESLYTKEEN